MGEFANLLPTHQPPLNFGLTQATFDLQNNWPTSINTQIIHSTFQKIKSTNSAKYVQLHSSIHIIFTHDKYKSKEQRIPKSTHILQQYQPINTKKQIMTSNFLTPLTFFLVVNLLYEV